MARRHEDWNIGLAEDLRDPEFAREFLLGAIDEEVPLQVALGKVVRVERRMEDGNTRMGVAAVIERYDIIRGEAARA